MQILTGTRRDITLMQWNEQLKKAEKRLADSEECYRRFQDEDSKQWVDEDKKKLEEIKKKIEEVTNFMDENGIN